MKVSKFGGSSLADAKQMMKVIDIVKSDPERKVIVVSAPGKRNPQDIKVTDLFYIWHHNASAQLPYQEYMDKIYTRYIEIVKELGLKLNIAKEIGVIENTINCLGGSPDYAASRGEYLSGLIMAKALGFKYINPEDCIRFDCSGKHIMEDKLIYDQISGQNSVIPGFYGAMKENRKQIKTFSRGGSDLTSTIVARALRASVCENWTDVSGLLMCDPRIVHNPLSIKEVTYRELRELSYMGANVFHEEAMFPVHQANIPTNIRNTNNPEHPGTMIYSNLTSRKNRIITGIAGRGGFVVINITKMLMNKEIGFAKKVLSVLEEEGISFENMPGGIDSLSIIIDRNSLGNKSKMVISKIEKAVKPDTIKISDHIAMIAVVGRSMSTSAEIVAKIFSAIAKEGINIKMITQGSSELSIIIGVEEKYYQDAIRSIYKHVI